MKRKVVSLCFLLGIAAALLPMSIYASDSEGEEDSRVDASIGVEGYVYIPGSGDPDILDALRESPGTQILGVQEEQNPEEDGENTNNINTPGGQNTQEDEAPAPTPSPQTGEKGDFLPIILLVGGSGLLFLSVRKKRV